MFDLHKMFCRVLLMLAPACFLVDNALASEQSCDTEYGSCVIDEVGYACSCASLVEGRGYQTYGDHLESVIINLASCKLISEEFCRWLVVTDFCEDDRGFCDIHEGGHSCLCVSPPDEKKSRNDFVAENRSEESLECENKMNEVCVDEAPDPIDVCEQDEIEFCTKMTDWMSVCDEAPVFTYEFLLCCFIKSESSEKADELWECYQEAGCESYEEDCKIQHESEPGDGDLDTEIDIDVDIDNIIDGDMDIDTIEAPDKADGNVSGERSEYEIPAWTVYAGDESDTDALYSGGSGTSDGCSQTGGCFNLLILLSLVFFLYCFRRKYYSA